MYSYDMFLEVALHRLHCRLWVCSQSWTEKCEVGGTVRAFALDLSAVISGNYKVSH